MCVTHRPLNRGAPAAEFASIKHGWTESHTILGNSTSNPTSQAAREKSMALSRSPKQQPYCSSSPSSSSS
eukprot:CAMPEP_0204220278 /NCGR_PEP_ID=MMETSP0361-20130328/80843_1 /ASSEMBLY_ACC=CAM_ASM_000343 /TAXON_ID=268821 /ORGANISM="Scrippsiella Hangoei, Strain SHTV-5" /LENGTH=69 /DNA_ID=CAMNT_0051185649 /DNA_START=91 /DNA_END=296 /DNA_ORIENTATION=-